MKNLLIESIYKNIVSPLTQEIKEQSQINKQTAIELEKLIGFICIRLLFNKYQEVNEKLEQLRNYLFQNSIAYDFKEIEEKIFALYLQWRVNHTNLSSVSYAEKESEQVNVDDGFFFEEGLEADSAIDDMHIEEHEKISSEELFEKEEISIEEIEHLDELKHELESIEVIEIDHFVAIIEEIAKELKFILEFKNLNYAFNNLAILLKSSSLEKEDILLILDELRKDIIDWIDVVFIKKTAQDVHYFDASFLSNITLIEAFFEEK